MFRSLAALCSLLIVAAGVCVTVGAPASAGGCPKVAYFAVGGNGNPESRGVPHAPASAIRITYPADVMDGDRSRAVARDKLNRAARDMRRACPGIRLDVYGYSLGASAASLAIDAWQSDAFMNRNTTFHLFGNPRRRLSPNGYGGIEASGLPNVPATYSWFGQMRRGPIVGVDRCNLGRDIICDSPSPLPRDLLHAKRGLDGYLSTGHRY